MKNKYIDTRNDRICTMTYDGFARLADQEQKYYIPYEDVEVVVPKVVKDNLEAIVKPTENSIPKAGRKSKTK